MYRLSLVQLLEDGVNAGTMLDRRMLLKSIDFAGNGILIARTLQLFIVQLYKFSVGHRLKMCSAKIIMLSFAGKWLMKSVVLFEDSCGTDLGIKYLEILPPVRMILMQIQK